MSTTTTMARTPGVGEKAPNFELITGKDANGTVAKFNLHEAVKKGPVVVAFFPGAFTGTCTKEMACFTNDWNKYAQLGAQFIGVSVDSAIALKAFVEKNNYKVPFGSDIDRKVLNQWNLTWNSWWGPVYKRATFIVDKTGTIRYANVQANADQEPNYAEIQTALKGLK